MPSVVRKDLRRYESSVSLSNGAPPYDNVSGGKSLELS